jgi:hypothetical protein
LKQGYGSGEVHCERVLTVYAEGNMIDLSRKKKTADQLGEMLARKAAARSVTSLYLSYNDLPALPLPAIFRLDCLTALFVSGNELRELPDMSPLRALAWLDASENKIAKLPESLCSMVQLRQLDLSSNCLAAVPSGLARLTNLHMLSLSGNIDLPQRLATMSPTGGLEGCQVFVEEVCEYFKRLENCRDAMYETLLCFQAMRQGTAAWNVVPAEVVQFFILPYVWSSRHDDVWEIEEEADELNGEELEVTEDDTKQWGSS